VLAFAHQTIQGEVMTRMLKLTMTIVLAPAALLAQGGTRTSVEGVWKVVQRVTTGTDALTAANPASLFIFTRGYYSLIYVSSAQPRALMKDPDKPTDQEKLAAFDSFFANSGTYEIAGTTLTTHPIVARSPNFMAGGSEKYQFRVQGDTLWLTERSAELRMRVGQNIVPSASPASEDRLKLVRVQ
jgi:hypothetical protein